MSRPTVVTDDVKKRILDLLRAGISQTETLTIVGVSFQSFSRATKGDIAFGDGVKKAALEGKASLVAKIFKASGSQWTAAAWLLERKYWQEYAARRPDSYSGEDLAAIAVQMADVARRYLPKESLPEFSREIQEVLRGFKYSKTRRQAK